MLSATYVNQTLKIFSRSTSYMRANFAEGLYFREEFSVLEQSRFSASTECVLVYIKSVQI